jgi:hypothetical protein
MLIFHPPCLASVKQEEWADFPPAGGKSAAATRSFNPRIFKSGAQLDEMQSLAGRQPSLQRLQNRVPFTSFDRSHNSFFLTTNGHE